MLAWPEYLKILTALIAIVNPIGAVPLYISLSQGRPDLDKKKTIRTTVLTVLVVLTVVLLAGQPLLRFFGITLPAFRVGGGILILMMAISMMHARQPRPKFTKEEAAEADAKATIAVVPLGIPLLAGPGAISTMIISAEREDSIQHRLLLFAAILIVALIISLTLNTAPKIAKLLGKTGINIVTRIMGLIMAAVGVEFIADGMGKLFPGLM